MSPDASRVWISLLLLGALHGLNAFVIFGCAAYAGRKIAATSHAGQVRREESATV